MSEAAKLDQIDTNLVEIKKEVEYANNKLDDIMRAQTDLRDGQNTIIESQSEQTGMLRSVVKIRDHVAGINLNTKWLAGAVVLMACAVVGIAITCVVAITHTTFSGSASAFGASGNIGIGQK